MCDRCLDNEARWVGYDEDGHDTTVCALCMDPEGVYTRLRTVPIFVQHVRALLLRLDDQHVVAGLEEQALLRAMLACSPIKGSP